MLNLRLTQGNTCVNITGNIIRIDIPMSIPSSIDMNAWFKQGGDGPGAPDALCAMCGEVLDIMLFQSRRKGVGLQLGAFHPSLEEIENQVIASVYVQGVIIPVWMSMIKLLQLIH